ncbi:hypothetical protein N7456_007798 [Penicillium angulare]|uniref:Uncharacterized protein n=1 Tax=Penicillium angulare TaxID=116970 RepID=A0A9W9FBC5_9EURO|nr:hypothetical protein N7456_007798 [Penicillium angulare]
MPLHEHACEKYKDLADEVIGKTKPKVSGEPKPKVFGPLDKDLICKAIRCIVKDTEVDDYEKSGPQEALDSLRDYLDSMEKEAKSNSPRKFRPKKSQRS